MTMQVRRLVAFATALLWLVCVELLPNLHLATHAEHAHTHAADGTIVAVAHAHAHAAPHDHASDEAAEDLAALGVATEEFAVDDELFDQLGVAHEHAEELAQVASPEREPVPANPLDTTLGDGAAGHAAAGLAHHAVALLAPPLPLTSPVAAPCVATWRHAAPIARHGSSAPARPTARGPPIHS